MAVATAIKHRKRYNIIFQPFGEETHLGHCPVLHKWFQQYPRLRTSTQECLRLVTSISFCYNFLAKQDSQSELQNFHILVHQH